MSSPPLAAAALSPHLHTQAPLPPPLALGSPEHRAAKWALFVGGFSTFAMFYGPQPLLPLFAREFGLSPADSSAVLSATSGAMALGLIPAGLLAQRLGPKTVMVVALMLGAAACLLSAIAPSYGSLIALRALLGLALAGVPAVAAAYLSEELDPAGLGQAIGLVIAGNAAGGMTSRLVSGLLADLTSWRMAFAGLGCLGAVAAFEFWRSLPASRRFRPSAFEPAVWAADLRHHLRDAGLPWLFAIAFLLMGSFVSLYNYLGYRLGAAPFSLSHTGIGAIFLLYVLGMIASPWAGRRADHAGPLRTLSMMLGLMALGLALTVLDALPAVIAGVALYTFGFFGAHSVASGWVGRRTAHARTLAASMYLCAYYLGAGAMGWASGHAWSEGGWTGLAGFLGLLLAGCGFAASRLRR